jgi:hypothetical protein
MVILTSFRQLFTCGLTGCALVLVVISGLIIGVDLLLDRLGVPSGVTYVVGYAIVGLLVLFVAGRSSFGGATGDPSTLIA